MKKPFAISLAGALVSLSVPAFASGYGPAPSFQPVAGVPASQGGQSEQTRGADRKDAKSGPRKWYAGVNGGPNLPGRDPVPSAPAANAAAF